MDEASVTLTVFSSVDCVSRIANSCGLRRADVGNCRVACKSLRRAIDSSVDHLYVQNTDVERLCGLLKKLHGLRHLETDRLFESYKSYGALCAVHAGLQKQLAAQTRLTALVISGSDVRHLGALKWAHHLVDKSDKAADVLPDSSSSSNYQHSEWYTGEYTPLVYIPHGVYWLPDWLAAPPNLKTLVIAPPRDSSTSIYSPDSTSSSSIGCSTTVIACLWLSSQPWGSKLTGLHIYNIPFIDRLPPTLSRLTMLQQLSVVGCSLQPRAVVQLLRQVGCSCKALQKVCLAHNDLWQLPSHGWHELTGVQELDLSHCQLTDLPSDLSQLTQLTALQVQHNQLRSFPTELSAITTLRFLDVSHNWLSGFRVSTSGGDTSSSSSSMLGLLVRCWPQLEVLRLQNVSDKRGSLALPAELTCCQQLREVAVGHNHDLDWDSLAVLEQCKGLQSVDLSGLKQAEALPRARLLLHSLQQRLVDVRWA